MGIGEAIWERRKKVRDGDQVQMKTNHLKSDVRQRGIKIRAEERSKQGNRRERERKKERKKERRKERKKENHFFLD